MKKRNLLKIYNINILITILVLSVISAVGLILFDRSTTEKKQDTIYGSPLVVNFNHGWKVSFKGNEKKEDLPLALDYKKDREYTLTRNLDEILSNSDNTLCLVTDFSDFSVYLDDKPIYSFKDIRFDSYKNIAKRNVYMIGLPNGFQNKELKIKLRMGSNSSLTYSVKNVLIGERDLVTRQLISSEVFRLTVIVIIAILSLILIFLFGLAVIYRLSNVVNLFCLSIFSMLALVYVFSESNLCLILINNSYVVNSMTYLSMMLLPVPLLILAIYYIKNNKYRYLYLCAYIGIINFIAQVILNHYQIFDYKKMLIVTHVIIIIILLSIILSIFYINLDKDDGTKDFICHLIPMALGGMVDIVLFDFKITASESLFSQIGMIIFIAMESRVIARKYNNLYSLSIKTEVYKNIAYTDVMTNIGNRSAYEKKLKLINRNIKQYGSIWCLSVDANNLKTVNDSYGHSYGDELIKGLAFILKEIFEISGDCFRVGGDEFVVLLYNISPERVRVLLQKFSRAIEMYNEDDRIKLSVALGYDSYNEYMDSSIEEVINRADMRMYQNKKELKQI